LAQTRADTLSSLHSTGCFSGFFILTGDELTTLLSTLSSYDKPWHVGDITVKSIANRTLTLQGDVSQDDVQALLAQINILFSKDSSSLFALHRRPFANKHKHLIQAMFAEYLIIEILTYNPRDLSVYFADRQKISRHDLTGSNLLYAASRLLNSPHFLRKYDVL